MEDEKIWKSNDFYLCAICIASGASLICLERGGSKFVTFVLNISPREAEKIISNHWDRKLKVPTRDLIEAINELRTRLHSGV